MTSTRISKPEQVLWNPGLRLGDLNVKARRETEAIVFSTRALVEALKTFNVPRFREYLRSMRWTDKDQVNGPYHVFCRDDDDTLEIEMYRLILARSEMFRHWKMALSWLSTRGIDPQPLSSNMRDYAQRMMIQNRITYAGI